MGVDDTQYSSAEAVYMYVTLQSPFVAPEYGKGGCFIEKTSQIGALPPKTHRNAAVGWTAKTYIWQ